VVYMYMYVNRVQVSRAVSSVRLYVGLFINNLLNENKSKILLILRAKKWDNDETNLMRIVIICTLLEILQR
jgi:hypothetical protein